MVGRIVGYVQFDVLVLRLFPSGVVIPLDSDNIFSIQVSKYLSVTAITVLIAFFSMVLLASTIFLAIFSIVLLMFGSLF